MEANSNVPQTPPPVSPTNSMNSQSEQPSQNAFHLSITKSKFKYIVFGVVLFMLVGTGFYVLKEPSRSDNMPDMPMPTIMDAVWMEIDPTQCMTNPWEKDWLQSHNDDYPLYPKDKEAQKNIIKDFFEEKGAVIGEIVYVDFETLGKDPHVCLACSCPGGATMFVTVFSEDDATILQEYGFKLSEDPTRLISTTQSPTVSATDQKTITWAKTVLALNCDREGVKYGEEFSADEFHLKTKNELDIQYIACDRIGASFPLYYARFLSPISKYFWSYSWTNYPAEFINITFVNREELVERYVKSSYRYLKQGRHPYEVYRLLGYLHNRYSSVSKKDNLYITPHLACNLGGPESIDYCNKECSKEDCLDGMKFGVYLKATKYIALGNESYVGFTIKTKPIITSDDKRLINLLRDNFDEMHTRGDNLGCQCGGLDEKVLIPAFQGDFNSLIWNGRSPLQVAEELLGSIDIDEEFLNIPPEE